MNRVLSLPHTPLFPGSLEILKAHRSRTVVSDKGTVRFESALGPIEMGFSTPEHQLAPGTEVFVWWKGGGFVCAPAAEWLAEERESRRIAQRVALVRAKLAAAREERRTQVAAHVDIDLDLPTLPLQQPVLGASGLFA